MTQETVRNLVRVCLLAGMTMLLVHVAEISQSARGYLQDRLAELTVALNPQ